MNKRNSTKITDIKDIKNLNTFFYNKIEDLDSNSESENNENFEDIKILEIRKNEHFGDILMFLNLRSPLILRTKTKKAELFLLHKSFSLII